MKPTLSVPGNGGLRFDASQLERHMPTNRGKMAVRREQQGLSIPGGQRNQTIILQAGKADRFMIGKDLG